MRELKKNSYEKEKKKKVFDLTHFPSSAEHCHLVVHKKHIGPF